MLEVERRESLYFHAPTEPLEPQLREAIERGMNRRCRHS